jgi:hypothetical protein
VEINEKDRLLFMKYAMPCAGVLVQRGNVAQEDVDEIITAVKAGKVPRGAEKMCKVAFAACSLIAKDRKKDKIDREVINHYFHFAHDEVIDRRYEEMGDFDTNSCRIRAGVVEAVGKDFAVVSNSSGRRKYKTDFVAGLKKDDIVTTHWNFVVEKIDRATAEKMIEQKAKLKVR